MGAGPGSPPPCNHLSLGTCGLKAWPPWWGFRPLGNRSSQQARQTKLGVLLGKGCPLTDAPLGPAAVVLSSQTAAVTGVISPGQPRKARPCGAGRAGGEDGTPALGRQDALTKLTQPPPAASQAVSQKAGVRREAGTRPGVLSLFPARPHICHFVELCGASAHLALPSTEEEHP